jgi:ribonuclease BN (tRNA processing enzyme)
MNEKRLIDILYQQLKDSGNYELVIMDQFNDDSGMWIEAFKKTKPDENLSRIVEYLQFTGDGQTLTVINTFSEHLNWSQSVSKKIT